MTIEGPTSDGTPEVTPELTLAVTPDETPEAVSAVSYTHLTLPTNREV